VDYKLKVREATPEDIPYLAENIRDADRRELEGVSGLSPQEAFRISYEITKDPFTVASPEGNPLLMGGVVPSSEDRQGVVWMMGTDGIRDYTMEFLRRSKDVLSMVSKDYDLIYNIVDKRNTLHTTWMCWLGFKFIRDIPKYGAGNINVLEFARII
jgi:hypothetical protein